MYYIINELTDVIVERLDALPTRKELQEIANEIRGRVYVIRGENIGLTAEPTDDDYAAEIEREGNDYDRERMEF